MVSAKRRDGPYLRETQQKCSERQKHRESKKKGTVSHIYAVLLRFALFENGNFLLSTYGSYEREKNT